MAKLEWGTKRECRSCGVRFYDLRHDPISCPKCGTIFEIVVTKPRTPTKEVREEAKPPTPAAVKAVAAATPGAEGEEVAAEDDEEEEFLEDASELAEEDVALEIDGKIAEAKKTGEP